VNAAFQAPLIIEAPPVAPLDLARLLSRHRYRCGTETQLQDGIAKVLTDAAIPFRKELHLSARDRPDFLIGGLALELKIKGTFASAFRQVARYTEHEQISAVMLIGTPRWVKQMPHEINQKPIYCVHLLASLL
jgi:hypothetical protein